MNDADGQIPYTCSGNLGSGTLTTASGTATVLPTQTQNCVFSVDNGAGSVNNCTATVTVGTVLPTCTASFNPATVQGGQSSTLSWSSTNDADGQIPYTCTGNLGSGTLSDATGTQSFSPDSTQSCSFTVQDASGQTATCTATVTVAACGQISISPTSIDFGVLAVHGSETQTITITNIGSGPLTLNSASLPPAPFFIVTGGTCTDGLVIPSGGNCTVSVVMSPTAPGQFTGSFAISSNTQCTNQTTPVQLTGIAITAGGNTTGLALEQSSNNNGYPDDPWQWAWGDVGVATGYPKVGWPVSEETLYYTSAMAPPTGYGYRISNVGGSTLQIYVQRSNASSGHPTQTMSCRYGATFTEGSYSYTNSLGSTVTFTDLVTLPPNSSCCAYVWYGSPSPIDPYFSTRPTGPIVGEFATGSGTGSSFIQANGTVHSQIEHPIDFMAYIDHPFELISMYP